MIRLHGMWLKGEVTIQGNVTTICDSAFYGCYGLTSITIPGSVTYIGPSAFNFCTALTSITIPDSVEFIDNFAFVMCRNLTSIIINDSVASRGIGVFDGCPGFAWEVLRDYSKSPNGRCPVVKVCSASTDRRIEAINSILNQMSDDKLELALGYLGELLNYKE